jgi:hypothetical protein
MTRRLALPKLLRDAVVDRLTAEKLADKRTIDNLANRYRAAAHDLDVARRRVARDVARIEALATEVELLDATLAKADSEHNEMSDRIEAVRALHQPFTEEVERWPDDDFEPPVLVECMVKIQVCRECGYKHDGETPVFRSWPCPTIRALNEDSSPAGASSKEDAQRNAAVDETAARAGASSPHGIEVAPNPAGDGAEAGNG